MPSTDHVDRSRVCGKHLVLALAIGVVLTVGIAWWSEYRTPLYGGTEQHFTTAVTGMAWQGNLLTHGPCANGVSSSAVDDYNIFRKSLPPGITQILSHGPPWSRVRIPPTREQYEKYQMVVEDARGWPLPALMALHTSPTNSLAWDTQWGVPLAKDQGGLKAPRALPLRPIIGGFLIDWLIFTVVSYLIFFWMSHIRRTRRARTDRCQECGHILNRLPRCPECGTAIALVAQASGSVGTRRTVT